MQGTECTQLLQHKILFSDLIKGSNFDVRHAELNGLHLQEI